MTRAKEPKKKKMKTCMVQNEWDWYEMRETCRLIVIVSLTEFFSPLAHVQHNKFSISTGCSIKGCYNWIIVACRNQWQESPSSQRSFCCTWLFTFQENLNRSNPARTTYTVHCSPRAPCKMRECCMPWEKCCSALELRSLPIGQWHTDILAASFSSDSGLQRL